MAEKPIPPKPIPLPGANCPYQSLVIKDELNVRVEKIELAEQSIVLKTYRNRPFLLWRTFLCRSRAEREYRNLEATFQAGVPCVEPLAWDETRILGCVPCSCITTAYVESSRSVRELLRAGVGPALRRRLARAMGTLARELHRAGILWCTMTPRNILVEGVEGVEENAKDPLLHVLDQPAAVRFGQSIHQTRRAWIDLCDIGFSQSRRREFSRGDRFAMLLAYCQGDRGQARRIWRALRGRSSLRNRLEKNALMALFNYILPLRRHPRTGAPSTSKVQSAQPPNIDA